MQKQKSPNDGHPHRRAMDHIILYLQPGVTCDIYRSPKIGDIKGFTGPSEPVGNISMNAKRELWFERKSDGERIQLAGGDGGTKSAKPVQDY